MTLKQLEYFLSCATLLNFRKTAQLHYISAPTLSRHIAALEEELGVELFVRDSHNVRLTSMGKQFFDTAERMLGEYQHFYDRTNLAGIRLKRQGDPFLAGSYAFDGMYGQLVEGILKMPDFFLNRPIHIDFIAPGKMIPSVLNGDLQVGIDTEAHVRGKSDLLGMRLLSRVPFHAAVEKGHPLSRKRHIRLDELLLWFEKGVAEEIHQHLRADKLPSVVDSAESLCQVGELIVEALPEFLNHLEDHPLSDQAVAILPALLTAGCTSRLHHIEIIGAPCCTNYVLFWRKDKRNHEIERFLEIVS